jgi:hypothetical protein
VPTVSDHRLLVLTIYEKKEKLSGQSLWRNNDKSLENDEYCTLMHNTITKALSEIDNPCVAWDWWKCKAMETGIKYGKEKAAEKKE